MLRLVERFFVTWRFAAFAICLLGLFALLVAGLLWIPPAPSGMGAFAEDFRVWCFGSEGGGRDGSALMRFGVFFELLSLAALIALIWLKPIRAQLRASAAAFVPYAVAALVAVGAMAGSLWLLGGPTGDATVFPARELRTALTAPRLALVDQAGEEVSLEKLRGRVVLVTGVYATCGLACPRILGQAKRVVAGLSSSEQAELTVLGITLDPQHDTVAALGAMAAAQQIAPPLYHLLTGEEAAVEKALDDFQVERKRNAQTGMIDHANVFALIDRQGRIAYRFTLGELQERWMLQGLRTLLAEPVAVTARND